MSLNRRYEEAKVVFDVAMQKVVELQKVRALVSAEDMNAAKAKMTEAHDALTDIMWQLSPLSQPEKVFNPEN